MKRMAWLVALVVILGAGLAAGPAQAQICTDRITVTVGDWVGPESTPTDWNPWNLWPGDTFEIELTYDPDSILSTSTGYIEFAEYTDNTFVVDINGPDGTFNQTNDWEYDGDPGDAAPSGFLVPSAPFNPENSVWYILNYSGQIGNPYNGFSAGLSIDVESGSYDDSYLGFYIDGGGTASWERSLIVNLDGFNPCEDRTCVPIPGTLLLLGPGLVSILAIRKRRAA